MEAPLLQEANDQQQQQAPGGALVTGATCAGVKGQLTIGRDGGIAWEPHEVHGRACCCGSCSAQHRPLQIPGWHVVGAALESPVSFRVWWCSTEKGSGTSTSSRVSPRVQLHKTLPFACATGSEASACVQRVRQGAAWQGRDSAPRVAAIINPISGQGRSSRVFEQQIVPVLEDAAGMSVTQLVTQHAGHASELMASLNLSAVDLVVVVGGDGTVYEGLQGLLGRPDWDAARLVPLAHIPAGSGNGLAHSCGLRDAQTAAFAICKGVLSPMDVASVLQPPSSRRYMMLSVAYGTLANLDVNTEPLRWMGDARFTLGALWEVFRGKFYTAGIAWLPADDDNDTPAAAAAANGHSESSLNNNNMHSQDSSNSSATHLQQQASASLPVSDARLASVTAAGTSQLEGAGGPYVSLSNFQLNGPELPILQQQLGRLPLAVPPPESAACVLGPRWQSWERPLPLFACVNPPFIAASSKLNPWGGLNSGHFNMLWLDVQPGLIGRLQAVDLLSKAETGGHADSPYMVQRKVRAMLFEPRDADTYLQLDGEVIPNAPIYMEVHAGLLRVVIHPAHPDEPAAAASRQHF